MHRSMYMRNLVKGYLKKKVFIIVFLIIFILAFGFMGVRNAYPEKISDDLSSEVQQYNDSLATYDEIIRAAQENIDTVQGQVDYYETYCNESIFMQIDPSQVCNVTVQYSITANDEDATRATNIVNYALTNWANYVKGGTLRNNVVAKLNNEIPSKYLSELIGVWYSGNSLFISAKHYDMEVSKAIMQAIMEEIDNAQDAMIAAAGDFTMTKVDYSENVVSDSTVQDTQNTQLNNLRTYKNLLADFQNKLITQQTNKNTYEQQYKPAGVNTDSPKKTLVKYGGLGVVAGILIPFILFALWYTISNRLKSKEDLMVEGMNILGTYNGKKGFSPAIGRIVTDMKLLASQKGIAKIFVCVLGESKYMTQAVEELSKALAEVAVETAVIPGGAETAEQLADLIETGHCIFVTEAGNSTYTQIEEQVQLCKRYDVSVWGSIVLE